MPLATYQGLALEAAEPGEQTHFWAEVLGLEPHLRENGDGELRTSDGQVVVRLHAVPEAKTAKNRLHLDVNAASVQDVLDAGATFVAEFERWTTLSDPDGQ